ncbi:RNA-binding motif protein, X-linked 2 [Diretmus argenteus]
MNPLTKVRLINELNEREADLGVKETVSWHSEYKDSAWIFVGGFPYELTEGDIICVFSQYGEICNINLVRDKKTGKSKGFCFICYEDQRSTILAVDNFNGIKIKGRTIRVDHVQDYRPPRDSDDMDDVTKRLREDGCAPKLPDAANAPNLSSSSESEEEEQYRIPVKKPKKDKKEKKKKKKEKKEKKKALKQEKGRGSRSSSSPPLPPLPAVRVKQEKDDAGYDKYNQRGTTGDQRNGDRGAACRVSGRRLQGARVPPAGCQGAACRVPGCRLQGVRAPPAGCQGATCRVSGCHLQGVRVPPAGVRAPPAGCQGAPCRQKSLEQEVSSRKVRPWWLKRLQDKESEKSVKDGLGSTGRHGTA